MEENVPANGEEELEKDGGEEGEGVAVVAEGPADDGAEAEGKQGSAGVVGVEVRGQKRRRSAGRCLSREPIVTYSTSHYDVLVVFAEGGDALEKLFCIPIESNGTRCQYLQESASNPGCYDVLAAVEHQSSIVRHTFANVEFTTKKTEKHTKGKKKKAKTETYTTEPFPAEGLCALEKTFTGFCPS